ncbi:MAG: CotH kinase family protein [Bacteroidales bacterium]|nr:CotH kinase family protein [Bacteroidales bacterium]
MARGRWNKYYSKIEAFKRICRIIAVSLTMVVLLFSCGKEEDDPNVRPADEKDWHDTGLPHLYIYTPEGTAINSKTVWVEGATVNLFTPDGEFIDYGKANIKGRGNSTWGLPKKPYALKLENAATLCGMASDKRWNLLANYIDRTDIRNAIAFKVAQKARSFDWTPHGEFVELYLNSVWQGNYFLCEHIKIGDHRLNLKKGGYLLELDVNYDEDYKFKSDLLSLPVQIKDWKGGDMTEERFNEIKAEFNEIESKIVTDDITTSGWQDYIDMDTFIDWWFVYELVQCGEPGHPKSSYMYRDKGGKLKAGPVWDFDWGTFRGSEVKLFRIKNSIFYGYLFKDPSFVKRLKEKWLENRGEFRAVADYFDVLADKLRVSVDHDKTKWSMTTTVNNDESMSFDEAVSTMKSNYKKHWEWMDNQIQAM